MVLRNNKIGGRELLVSMVASVIYAGVSLLFDEDLNLLFESDIFQNSRPMIFLLALISIFYGPVIGAFSAGFGNLFFDIGKGILLSEQFDLDNWVGFAANFAGGMVVGIFSKNYSSASSIFDFTDDDPDHVWEIFNYEYFKRLIRNTVASTIGFSIVVGAIIGYGLRLTPGFEGNSFDIFTKIAYSNGIYLLIAVPTFYILTTIVDFFGDKSVAEKREKSRTVEVSTDSTLYEVSAIVPKGEELFNNQWGAMELTIKNISDHQERFALRVSSNDIFSPARHLTPPLEPGQEDKMYFSVYPLSPGVKEAGIFVEDRHYKTTEGLMRYSVSSTGTVMVQKIMGLFLVAGLLVTGFSIFQNIAEDASLSKSIVVALVSIPIEMIIIYFLYWLNGRDVTKKLFGVYEKFLRGEEKKCLVGPFEEDTNNAQREIRRYRIISWIFLVLGTITFLGVWSILVYTEYLGNDLGDQGDYLIYTVILMFLLMFISQIYMEKADNKQEEIDMSELIEEKVILNAIATSHMIKNKTTRIEISVRNPFETKGMRLYLHTIDHISPKEYVLDITPGSTTTVLLDYTPLDEGKREITFEIVPFRDKEGNIMPAENTETFDQESLKFKVDADSVLGLSPTQISLIKKVIAGAGAISVAFSAVANVLNLQIDPQTLNTSIPLILILQSPVFWFYLYFQNKSTKRLESVE